jgi:hypothetical protein
MRIWPRSPNPLVRRLLELGCSEEQVRRHIEKVTPPPPRFIQSSHAPRPQDWLPWSFRIAPLRARQGLAISKSRSRPATSPHVV